MIRLVSNYPAYIPKDRLEIRHDLSLVYIRLSNGSIAVCDIIDYPFLRGQTKWAISKGYPYFTDYSGERPKTVHLHSLLFPDLPEGNMVDHISGNKLDNRRENLRIVSRSQNNQNRAPKKGTSKYKGVSFDSSRSRWISSIQVNGKTIHVGRFLSEKDAAIAYDKEAYYRFGEYARLNFPKLLAESVLLKTG